MKCVRCGNELIDGVSACPNCGYQHDDMMPAASDAPESQGTDQSKIPAEKEKNLASELKSKIKKAFYIDHDDEEAMNYIDLYLSMIGIDAEIIEYQEKIKAKKREGGRTPSGSDRKDPSTENQKPAGSGDRPGEPLFELEIETPGETAAREDDEVPDQMAPDEPSPIQSDHQFFELDDDEFAEEEMEKELEIELNQEELEELVTDDNDRDDDQGPDDEDLLVLEPEEEILELEDEMVEAQSAKQENMEASKDPSSPFEIEINHEAQIPEEARGNDILSLSEFDSQSITPDREESPPPSESIQTIIGDPSGDRPGMTDSVESMLDNIKAKKKKTQRLLMIVAAAVVFVALLITLVLLTTKNRSEDVISQKAPVNVQTPPESNQIKTPLTEQKPAIDPQTQQYQLYLSQAETYLQKGDLKSAAQSIKLAKAIKETPETRNIEQEIQKQKAETTILNEVEKPEETVANSAEEQSYKRAMNSSEITLLESHLKKYPAGEHSGEIIKRIAELKKKNRESLEREIKNNHQRHKKVQLRSVSLSLNPENIQEIQKKTKSLTEKTEFRTIDGDKVLIDYSAGLMWHFWKESMEFRKAKWWANREYAGYFDWRLPTAEEAATLSGSMISSLIEKSATVIEIWTSDNDSRDARNIWVFLPLEGIFKIFSESDYKQICSVRSL